MLALHTRTIISVINRDRQLRACRTHPHPHRNIRWERKASGHEERRRERFLDSSDPGKEQPET